MTAQDAAIRRLVERLERVVDRSLVWKSPLATEAASVIRSLQAERDALREAATLAADTFARYAELHWAKGTEDAVTKGDANAELAKTMRAALAMQGEGS